MRIFLDANILFSAAKSDGAVRKLLESLIEAGAQHADTALEQTLPLPEKDRPVLAAAIRHRCAALVTGDRTHFGKLYGKTIHGTAIHSPRSLAQAVLGLR